jgi:hypothetical protein
MKEFLEIGPGPAEERVEQVGPNCDYGRMRKECEAFIRQLRRLLGPEPPGAKLKIRRNQHDFGMYMEVACYYDENDREGVEYASLCEMEYPAEWDEEAKVELGILV